MLKSFIVIISMWLCI